MSYTRIASCVATAYTIRYGNANAGAGPVTAEFTSPSTDLGDDVGLPISLGDGIAIGATGGGSIVECETGADVGKTDSGRAGIASSEEEVSMVILTVVLVVGR